MLFNDPPAAHFYWTKCLICPPLNHDMPPGGFDAYKGSFGRQEANEENLVKIYAIREAHHGQ